MMKVFETTYDGFIIVNRDGVFEQYEGRSLCPPDVNAWIKKHKLQKIDAFAHEAISYGMCDLKPRIK